jgi:hypothetical protein
MHPGVLPPRKRKLKTAMPSERSVSLRHRVAFGGRSLREDAPAGCVRLRFTVPGSRLYSFTIEAGGGAAGGR